MKFQRDSNFKPVFSDEELITVYLFGQLNEKFNHRQIHQFIREYWSDWFPCLPSYQAFNRRLNLLADNFQILFAHLLAAADRHQPAQSLDCLIDSLPVMLAVGTRTKRARGALEFAKTGFCATKQIHFHGVRRHLIGHRRTGRLPTPLRVWLREGNINDLVALREIADELPAGINLFGDKAYADAAFKRELLAREIRLLTPVKKPKKKPLTNAQKLFNKTVSSFRQPIESFFKWLIDKTDIQRASQVRSTDGLIIHCLGKLTFALFLLISTIDSHNLMKKQIKDVRCKGFMPETHEKCDAVLYQTDGEFMYDTGDNILNKGKQQVECSRCGKIAFWNRNPKYINSHHS